MNYFSNHLVYDDKKTFSIDFMQILLFLFIISATTLSYIEGLSKLVILYGLSFTFFYVIYILNIKKISIHPEVIAYLAWVIWSIGGYPNAINKSSYLEGLRTVIQIASMFFVISGLISARSNMANIAMAGLIAGGWIQIIFIFVTGELTTAFEIDTKMRVSGLSKNANSFALQMLITIFAVFFLWGKKLNFLQRFFLACTFLTSLVGIIYSGSRNGFLGLLSFLALWFFLCKRKNLPKHPIFAYSVLIFIFVVIYLSVFTVFETTLVGHRLSQLEDNSSQTRIYLYSEGLEFIKKNPFFGIGLNNFSELSSTGLYSHSDYLEVAANTGVVGFILYFSIYIILWFRIKYLKKLIDGNHLLYIINIFSAAILTILIFGFGKPHITSKITWIFLAIVSGYTSNLKNILNDNTVR